MKQVTILMRAFGFLVVVGCFKAKYLLVKIDDVVDEYVQHDEEVFPVEYSAEDNVELGHFNRMAKKSAGISYSFEKI